MSEEMSGVIETGAEEQEVTEPAETQETGAEEQEVAEPADSKEEDTAGEEPESGKTDQDAAFAELRREKEAAEREAAELRDKVARTEAILARASDAEDPELELAAQVLGVDPDELAAEVETQLEDERIMAEMSSAQKELTRLKAEQAMERDLLEIRKVDPNVKDLNELGEHFLKCITAGMSATDAYYASKYVKEKTTVSPPAEIGKVDQSEVEKDFFTKEEVEAMSPKEVEKNLDKIEKSQMKW
ncbi:hypothetical protein LI177_02920 [bacterium 210820-DFI.6.37]|nr:hypothetical protein [bacterium 210820-DFI.6.37]